MNKMPNTIVSLFKKVLKMTKANKSLKQDIRKVLKSSHVNHWRYTMLPDNIRQLIRKYVIMDVKKMTFGSAASCARAYGVTSPNVTKWMSEDAMGIKHIRPRGRKSGVKNKWHHIINRNGTVTKVRFVRKANQK